MNSCYCPDQGLFIVAQPSSASIAQCDLIEVLATPIVSRLVLIKVPIHLADCRGVVAVMMLMCSSILNVAGVFVLCATGRLGTFRSFIRLRLSAFSPWRRLALRLASIEQSMRMSVRFAYMQIPIYSKPHIFLPFSPFFFSQGCFANIEKSPQMCRICARNPHPSTNNLKLFGADRGLRLS